MDDDSKIFTLLNKLIDLEKTTLNNQKVSEKSRLNQLESVIVRYMEDNDNQQN